MSHAHTPWNWVLLFECALDLVSDNKEVNVGTKFNLLENFWPDMVSSHKFNLVKNKIKNKKNWNWYQATELQKRVALCVTLSFRKMWRQTK